MYKKVKACLRTLRKSQKTGSGLMKYSSLSTTALSTYYLSKACLLFCKIDIHQRNTSDKESPSSHELEKVHGQT